MVETNFVLKRPCWICNKTNNRKWTNGPNYSIFKIELDLLFLIGGKKLKILCTTFDMHLSLV